LSADTFDEYGKKKILKSLLLSNSLISSIFLLGNDFFGALSFVRYQIYD